MKLIPTAKEFCENIDREEGEAWSNDYEELPLRMIEFAKLHVEALRKEILGFYSQKENGNFISLSAFEWHQRKVQEAYPESNIK